MGNSTSQLPNTQQVRSRMTKIRKPRVEPKFKGEYITRKSLQSIASIALSRDVNSPYCRFDTNRSEIINPNTGYALELDCYNPHMQLAVEYQGIQHTKAIHGADKQSKQARNDRIKVDECKSKDILLLTLNEVSNKDDIPEAVLKLLDDSGVDVKVINSRFRKYT